MKYGLLALLSVFFLSGCYSHAYHDPGYGYEYSHVKKRHKHKRGKHYKHHKHHKHHKHAPPKAHGHGHTPVNPAPYPGPHR